MRRRRRRSKAQARRSGYLASRIPLDRMPVYRIPFHRSPACWILPCSHSPRFVSQENQSADAVRGFGHASSCSQLIRGKAGSEIFFIRIPCSRICFKGEASIAHLFGNLFYRPTGQSLSLEILQKAKGITSHNIYYVKYQTETAWQFDARLDPIVIPSNTQRMSRTKVSTARQNPRPLPPVRQRDSCHGAVAFREQDDVHSRRTPLGSMRLMPSGRAGAMTRTTLEVVAGGSDTSRRLRRASSVFHR